MVITPYTASRNKYKIRAKFSNTRTIISFLLYMFLTVKFVALLLPELLGTFLILSIFGQAILRCIRPVIVLNDKKLVIYRSSLTFFKTIIETDQIVGIKLQPRSSLWTKFSIIINTKVGNSVAVSDIHQIQDTFYKLEQALHLIKSDSTPQGE